MRYEAATWRLFGFHAELGWGNHEKTIRGDSLRFYRHHGVSLFAVDSCHMYEVILHL